MAAAPSFAPFGCVLKPRCGGRDAGSVEGNGLRVTPHLEWKICHAHPCSVGVVLKFCAGILYGIIRTSLYDPRLSNPGIPRSPSIPISAARECGPVFREEVTSCFAGMAKCRSACCRFRRRLTPTISGPRRLQTPVRPHFGAQHAPHMAELDA